MEEIIGRLDVSSVLAASTRKCHTYKFYLFKWHSMDAGGDGQGGKKKKRILKRIIKTRKPDGSYTSKEIIITDPKEVGSFILINTFVPFVNCCSFVIRVDVFVGLFFVFLFMSLIFIS